VAALMAGEAYAVPIPANGSFRFVPFGSVRVDTDNISTTTMDKVLPASEMVNILTDPFMGHPNNLGVAVTDAVTLGYLTIPVPHPLGTPTLLATPMTVSVPDQCKYYSHHGDLLRSDPFAPEGGNAVPSARHSIFQYVTITRSRGHRTSEKKSDTPSAGIGRMQL
jgi:hypothetical protein